jgi:hypothetical protein
MEKNAVFTVKNRSDGKVIYTIKEDNIRREFQPGETRDNISFNELEKLSFQPGGRELIARYLQITNKEVTNILNIPTELEYYMSEADIRELILHGSLDAFLDCLDFAPVGVLDLVKKFAVALPCNDIAKRRAIKEKTGFDVDAAIRHIEEEKEDDNTVETPVATRRVQPAATETGRRVKSEEVPTPKYKVISTQ